MEKEILGYRKFTSSKGFKCCIALIKSPFSERDEKNGAVGFKCSEQFIPEEFHSQFQPSCVGKAIEMEYYIDGDRAYIKDIVVG